MFGDARVLVTGAAGFIGHHLVVYLVAKGYWVRGVDIRHPEHEPSPAHEFELLDLRRSENCVAATRDIMQVYHLAADMGGIGYISGYHAKIARNNVLMDTNMLEASRRNHVNKFLYSSSACVYPLHRQSVTDVTPLREEDVDPAEPEEGYGWEKLFVERLCRYYREDYGIETRIVRPHNVYGPLGAYEGGREKAPAAICRKVAHADDGDEIEVWGDGRQTRSFLYINDCVEGLHRTMHTDYPYPLNLGSNRLVTVDELVDIVTNLSGKRLRKKYDLSRPQGVRGRCSDNSRVREVLNWGPTVSLEDGLARTYRWIEAEVRKAQRLIAAEKMTKAGRA